MKSLETRREMIEGDLCLAPTKGCSQGLIDAYIGPPGVEILFAVRGRWDDETVRVVIVLHGAEGIDIDVSHMKAMTAHAEALLDDYMNGKIGFDRRLELEWERRGGRHV